jgi:hypothetical protein
MFDQRKRAVEVEYRRDRHGSDGGTGPFQRCFSVDVEAEGLASSSEVDANACGFLPSIAMKPVITQASNDPF